jgi:hypothetical protein
MEGNGRSTLLLDHAQLHPSRWVFAMQEPRSEAGCSRCEAYDRSRRRLTLPANTAAAGHGMRDTDMLMAGSW